MITFIEYIVYQYLFSLYILFRLSVFYRCGGRAAAFGHESQDAAFYAANDIDYVKEDSCNAAQDHPTAYHEYSLMRDALNATGKPIFFSLCGWNTWYVVVVVVVVVVIIYNPYI